MSTLRRAVVVLCALAVVWSVLIALTGGIVVHLGSIRLSSRSAVNPLLLAGILALCAVALARAESRHGPVLGTPRSRFDHGELAVLPALVGIGLAVAQWMHAAPLWLDEEMIALNVRDRSLFGLAGELWLGQSAPFGWLAVQRIAVLVFGTGERALRLLPLVFGAATILAALWVGRRWMGGVGAAVLVLLCAFGQWIAASFVELKHYSADAFWALLLPALAAWSLEAGSGRVRDDLRRSLVWWCAVAVGQWFGNGAVLVAPGCAVILLAVFWRRSGRRAAVMFALFGLVWAVSFAAHYMIALRYTLRSDFLRSYWSQAFPPGGSGVSATIAWLAAQFAPFALKPGGSGSWRLFWACAACGFAISRPRALGALYATVPLSAFVLAALRVVPLYERLSLWVVPALYVGIALFSDSAPRLARDAWVQRRVLRGGLAVIVGFVAFQLCSDILLRGESARGRASGRSNHQLDDRAAVRWLIDQREPGDAVMTTQLALPAIWWYGAIPVSSSRLSGSRLTEGEPILQAGYRSSGPDCRGDQLRDSIKGVRRLLVYFGFRFDDVPDGFDALLLESLADVGVVKSFRYFAEAGRGAVVEVRREPDVARTGTEQPETRPMARRTRLDGCVGVRLAQRW